MARSRRRGPTFAELSHDVWEEIVRATNHYDLMLKGVLLPMAGQSRVRREYPFLVRALVQAVGEHIVLTVCRLFDPKSDPRLTSLCNLLREAGEHHAADTDVTPAQRKLRDEFQAGLPALFATLEERWKSLLVIHRNAYLAHRNLLQMDALPDMTYLDIRAAITLAHTAYGDYARSYLNQDNERYWRLPLHESEPEGFLKWSRFDDYERHVREQDRRDLGFDPSVLPS